MARTGRPVIDNPKDTTIKIRIDKEYVERLNFLSNELGISKSEIVRSGIDILYQEYTSTCN